MNFSPWDILTTSLIGLIDLNPLLDLLFTPILWTLIFFID